ncbi:MAG: ABC transporter ATP-binding protein [Coriobacteriia bacterium]|nr:ABC transporter ATP-binding protein [Coriobacteriia bacterium]
MKLELQHINLSYEHKREAQLVLNNINLTVEDGSFVSLLGPSGAGKTSLLRIIAGLEIQDGGSVLFDNQAIDYLAPHKRRVGYVFQDLRLFPHLNVGENIAYASKIAKKPKAFREDLVKRMLEQVQLEAYESRRVSQLSGGQAQRVALARVLASDPQILLLDEPFSSLDEELRADMRGLLEHLRCDYPLTTIMVTHDRAEAFRMSDRVLYLDKGSLKEVYE